MNVAMAVFNFMIAALTVLGVALLIYDDAHKIKNVGVYVFMVALLVADGIKWLN